MTFSLIPNRRSSMAPAEVRAVREARGESLEQLAVAVDASPVEISAWEAGAVPVPADKAAALRWLGDLRRWERAVEAAGASGCAHGAELRARMPDVDVVGSVEVGRWSGQVMAHTRQCAACARRERYVAEHPAPEPPHGAVQRAEKPGQIPRGWGLVIAGVMASSLTPVAGPIRRFVAQDGVGVAAAAAAAGACAGVAITDLALRFARRGGAEARIVLLAAGGCVLLGAMVLPGPGAWVMAGAAAIAGAVARWSVLRSRYESPVNIPAVDETIAR